MKNDISVLSPLSHLATALGAHPAIPGLPKRAEESWRRTDPSLFFLPESEILRADGEAACLSAPTRPNTAAFVWKIEEEFFADAKDFIKGFAGTELEQNLGSRAFSLQINGNVAKLSMTENLRSLVKMESARAPGGAVFESSAVGAALGARLALSVPLQLKLKLTGKDPVMGFVLVNGKNGLAQSYNDLKIEIEEGGQVELAICDVGSHFTHHRQAVSLGKGAKLSCLWSNLKGGQSHTELLERTVELGEGSVFHDMSLFVGGGETRVLSNIKAAGAKSIAHCGALVVCQFGSVDYEPVHHHVGPWSETHLKAKMLGAGGVQAVFQGLIRVDAEAPHTVSTQINKNLLLSKRSRIDSLPRLEIVPNEVSCKHGSASGEVDSKQVYYLMTRGFSESEARALVVQSFAAEGLASLPEESFLKAWAAQMVQEQVGDLKVLR